ncbi:MAG: hypothetical protein D6791_05295 [Chloroflexi bacterium]|nr:MAG: hypothetical protein D6791_05295 [Chloroflexota bacterium]
MSRVIHTDSPGAQRQRVRRTIAEALRQLMAKNRVDEETRDLAALIVFSLRELAGGVDRSAIAWEKRGYYMKADRFRLEWEWVDQAADELEALIRAEDWTHLPIALARLTPRFADIKIRRFTRSPAVWQGCYQRLLETELSHS